MIQLPDGWTDRHTRVARFALHMMAINAQARCDSIAQGHPAPKGTAERLKQDQEDALAARELLAMILEPTTKKETT